MPWPSGPSARWVAFHLVLRTLQLEKHSTAQSVGLAVVLVCIAQTGNPGFIVFAVALQQCPHPIHLCWKRGKKKHGVKTQPLVLCPLCLERYKSECYGGLCWGLPDLRTPGFFFYFDSDEGSRQKGTTKHLAATTKNRGN